MAVYATAGIEVTAAFLSQHKVKGTVGDHRLHVFDCTTISITGIDEPTIERAKGRVHYTKVLMQLTRQHKMFTKVQFLQHQRLALSSAEFQIAYNKYDKELVEHQVLSKEES